MDKYHFLNVEKIVQIFSYIQQHSGVTDKLKLIKYLFFADRINIRSHYTFISLDHYMALANGPAGSKSLNILNKQTEYLDNYSANDLRFLENVELIGDSTRKIKDMPHDLLSHNEMVSLDTALDMFPQTLSTRDIVDISHDYPEWSRYKHIFDAHLTSSEFMILDDFFTNPLIENAPALQKFFGKDPLYMEDSYLEEAKQFYHESFPHAS